MLFSNPEIADFINENFEPSWESVRPVPRVSIDFGNGTVVERTLHGNVATYICDKNNIVHDVLPGVYSKTAFLKQLKQITNNWQTATKKQANYNHVGYPQASRVADKAATMNPAKASDSPELGSTAARKLLDDNLELDTAYNEKERREKIKSYLTVHPQSTPTTMKSWLYREVLHADLDDPYLGLHDALFANYPFVD